MGSYLELKPLTVEELKILTEMELETETERIVRDVFLFTCYTGIMMYDATQLTKDNFDGNSIQYVSSKTNNKITFRARNEAIDLAKQYDYKFPFLASQVFNRILKFIAEKAGIDKPVIGPSGPRTFRILFKK